MIRTTQGQEGIKGPPGGTVEEGQPIPVEVQDEGVTSVTIVVHGDPDAEPVDVPVPKDGKVVIPPQSGWRAGTLLIVMTGSDPVVSILVEIVPAPGAAGR